MKTKDGRYIPVFTENYAEAGLLDTPSKPKRQPKRQGKSTKKKPTGRNASRRKARKR